MNESYCNRCAGLLVSIVSPDMQSGGDIYQTKCLSCGYLTDSVMAVNEGKVLTKQEANKSALKRRIITVGHSQ